LGETIIYIFDSVYSLLNALFPNDKNIISQMLPLEAFSCLNIFMYIFKPADIYNHIILYRSLRRLSQPPDP